jgi:hypothetical protein
METEQKVSAVLRDHPRQERGLAVSNSAMDDGTRIQAVDLIRIAIGRLQRVHDSPQASSHHSEATIALADLNLALNVLNELGNANHRRVLPDLRLLVYRLETIDESNISEAHDDILEACLLIEDV